MEKYGRCLSCTTVKFTETQMIIGQKPDCIVCHGSGHSGDVRDYLQREADQEWDMNQMDPLMRWH